MSKLVNINTFSQMFGVPGNMVRQWIMRYNLPVQSVSEDNRTSPLGMIDMFQVHDWLWQGYALIPSMRPKDAAIRRLIDIRRKQLGQEWITISGVAISIQRIPEVKTICFLRQVDIEPVFRLQKLFFEREVMAQKLRFLVADEQVEQIRRVEWLTTHLR